MTLAIETGHILVLDGVEYPIVSAEKWQLSQRSSGSIRRAMVYRVSLKGETFENGKGSITTYATDIPATYLDPAGEGLKHTLGLETPHMLKETYIEHEGEFIRVLVEDLKT